MDISEHTSRSTVCMIFINLRNLSRFQIAVGALDMRTAVLPVSMAQWMKISIAEKLTSCSKYCVEIWIYTIHA